MERAEESKGPSLRRQLGIPLLILGTSGVLLALMVVSYMFYQNSTRMLSHELHIVTHLVAAQSRNGLLQKDHEQVKQALRNLRFERHLQIGCIYSENGYLFASYQGQDNAHCPQQMNLAPLRKGKQKDHWNLHEIYLPIPHNDQLLGLLYVRQGKQIIFAELSNTLALLALIAMLGLLGGFWILSRFFNRALQPLEALTEAAHKARTTQGMMPRVHKQRQDEVGELVDSFNHMLDVMEEKQQALQQSEARFRLLTESSPMGILRRNERFDVVFLNQRLQLLIGQPGCQQISRSQWLEGVAEEDLERYLAFQERMLSQQQPGSLEYRFRPLGEKEYRVFVEHLVKLDQGTNQPVAFVGSIMDITDLKQAQEQLEYQALYDSLTGLPNRQHLKNVLLNEVQQRQPGNLLAVMFLDLDNFKKINDTLGHDVGDQVLTKVSRRLTDSLHMLDVVTARMGGDEFVILLRTAENVRAIQFCANLITRTFSQPLQLDEQAVDITFSIGIAICPEHGKEVSQLLKHADIALYEAKRAGRNRSCIFNERMLHTLQNQQHIQQRLRQTLETAGKTGLSLAFQPQIHVTSRRFTSGECLCRWNDEELGNISPDRFIPVAEESGLILPLGQWIIDEACRLYKAHQPQLQQLGIQRIAINLSARQFFDANLLNQIEYILERHGVEHEELEIELTESVLLDDLDHTVTIMKTMRDSGFHIAIDDFGTGFSSLGYLKKLPITALKIDRTFIRDIPEDPHDMEITAAIIAMAHKLELTTIAEGVENQTQLDFLLEQGCDLAQGYYLGRPVPMAEFIAQQNRG